MLNSEYVNTNILSQQDVFLLRIIGMTSYNLRENIAVKYTPVNIRLKANIKL